MSDLTFPHVFRNQNFEPFPSEHISNTHSEFLSPPKTLKTQDFLSTYLKWSLNCVVFDLCRFYTSSFFFKAMLLNLLTIPQMWIMFISKKSDLFQIIHIQEPWEPPQDVLGLCPPSDCLSGLNMEGPQYSAPQRISLAVEYFKKVGTYGWDNRWFQHSIPWSSPTLPQDNLVQRWHRSMTTQFRLHFR